MYYRGRKFIGKYFRQYKTLFHNYLQYIRYKNPVLVKEKKTVHFDVIQLQLYGRYFYVLAKFFAIEGYQITLNRNFAIFNEILGGESYLQYLIKEKIVAFKKSKTPIICFNEKNLLPNYFNFLLPSNNSVDPAFYIPISMHPNFYHHDVHLFNLENIEKKKSIFMAGNFDIRFYGDEPERHFNVLSRNKIYDQLLTRNFLTIIKSASELTSFLMSNSDHKCIIIKTDSFRMHFEEYRKYLSQFSFFLACPGVVMPYCHNIAESMSVGCIPIIQKEYAEMMHPPLVDGHNSLFFNNAENLSVVIEKAYGLRNEVVSQMSNNVLDYYNTHLTPKSVVNKIASANNAKYYLLAEQTSVKLFSQS